MPTCSKCSDADLGRVCPHRQTLLITGEALDNFYAWVREAQQLRSTLADLIAELQDASTGYDPDCQNGCGDVPGAGCPTHYEQAVERAADRAEARLRDGDE